jgi:hypothetical protein
MSSLFKLVVDGITSFFSSGVDEKAEGEKKKKKKRDRDDADLLDTSGTLSTPTPRETRPRRDSETKSAMSDAVLKKMSAEARDAVLVALWETAHERAPGARLSAGAKEELVQSASDRCALPNLTFDALRMRVERIRGRGSTERKPGSGRPSLWTPEHGEMAKEVAREFGGEISRTAIWETVSERLGVENVNSRSKFIARLSDVLKRRRIRVKPTLNENQKTLRVAYARHSIDTGFSEEARTVFVDEKRFEASFVGVYNLPVEDSTPTKRIQSKSNPVFVMVLVAVMTPRKEWNGVVGMHFFTQRIAAVKTSRNREAGTIELHCVNVTKETYVQAFAQSIIPQLRKAIDDKILPKPTKKRPFFLQDDNAKPHRGPYAGQIDVSGQICKLAIEAGVWMEPKKPAQPPQSPDLNPLDTFVFRVLNLKFRRLRARDRVKRIAANSFRSKEGGNVGGIGAVRSLDFQEDAGNDDSGSGEEAEIEVETVPLRCKPESSRKRALCGGCSQLVKQNDKTAVQCDLRFGWWHFECVKAVIGDRLYARAKLPDLRRNDDLWVCPQCSMHLCRNDDKTAQLCLVCWKPSQRSGATEMGTDMVCCDSDAGGLFHKKCVQYDELEEENEEHWLCVACDTLIEDGYEPLESIEERPISGNNVYALQLAISEALDEIPHESFVRGFESRKEFIKLVHGSDGDNTYNKHWREHGKSNMKK